MFEVTTNLDKVMNDIEKNIIKAEEKTSRDLVVDMTNFKNELRNEQFSGKRGSIGLNTKSGKAKNSLTVDYNKSANGIDVNLYSDVNYISIHETITQKLDLAGALERKAPSLEKTVLKNLEKI